MWHSWRRQNNLDKKTSNVWGFADRITEANWQSIIQNFDGSTLVNGAELLCNGALLSKDSIQAAAFIEQLQDKLTKIQCPIPPDVWTLVRITKERADAVREEGGWLPPPVAVISEETSPAQFPRGVFPPKIEKYVDSVANSVQVDRSMVCAAVLATAALCMQGRFMVSYPSGNGHREHLCLYIVIVANPGERKTGVFQRALLPVYEWQKERREAYKLALAEYSAKAEGLGGEKEAIKKKLASKTTPEENKAKLGEDLAAITAMQMDLQPPPSPEILATDTTVEALATLMELTGETAGIFTDEADLFKIIAGLYNRGHTANIGLLLGAYDGSPSFRIRGSGTVALRRPLLSMCLFAQPVLFDEAQNNADLRGRGMMGRILFCRPRSMAGRRNVRCSEQVDRDAKEVYKQLLTGFLDMDALPDAETAVLEWEPEAAQVMLDYLQELENSMVSGGRMEAAADYASKAGGAAARITAILHLLWNGDGSGKISLATASRGIVAHKYFFGEKLLEMEQAQTYDEKLMQKVAEKLRELTVDKDRAYTTASELQQSVRWINGLHTVKELSPILDRMVDKNWIAMQRTGNKSRNIYVSPYFRDIL